MTSTQRYTLYTIIFLGLLMTSCSSDKCDDVICPAGYLCDEGTCLVDPDIDPCENASCPAGFTCSEGNCIQDNACIGVTCDTDQTCVNGQCLDVFETVVLTGTISAPTTMMSSKVYELAGKVVVESGVTLTIEPGTILKFREGEGSQASALVVPRGAIIRAMGTREHPIIMTSVLDDIRPGQLVGTNLTVSDAGLWGGLVLLGRAPVSDKTGDIEGLLEGLPADEEFSRYGGSNPADNSGELHYISIRHGGAIVSEGNEINGLTLGGVGSATQIDHVEVVANADDGIEFFGGTVSISSAVVYAQGDDGLDIDQNYAGTISNALVVHNAGSDSALEIDGPESSTYSDGRFTISNSTFIGAQGDNAKDFGGTFKSLAQGTISNCYIAQNFDGQFLLDVNVTDANSCAIDISVNNFIIENNEFYDGNINNAANYFNDKDEGCESAIDDLQPMLDDQIISAGNATSTSSAKGADLTEFDLWSWSAINNIF